jgi:hypothetical protein
MRISRNSKPREAGRQRTAAQAVLPNGRRLQRSTQPYARKHPRGEIKSCVGRGLVEIGVLPKWLRMGLRDSFSSPRRNNSSCTRKGGWNARAFFSGFRDRSACTSPKREGCEIFPGRDRIAILAFLDLVFPCEAVMADPQSVPDADIRFRTIGGVAPRAKRCSSSSPICSRVAMAASWCGAWTISMRRACVPCACWPFRIAAFPVTMKAWPGVSPKSASPVSAVHRRCCRSCWKARSRDRICLNWRKRAAHK